MRSLASLYPTMYAPVVQEQMVPQEPSEPSPSESEPMIQIPGVSAQLTSSEEFSNALLFIAFGIFALLFVDALVKLAISLGRR